MIRKLFLVLLIALMALPSTLTAYETKAQQDADYGERAANGFNVLVKQTYCSLSTTQVVTPTDITSTNTYSIAYAPAATVKKFPVKVKIQYLGTAKVYVAPYSTTAASGVYSPTATMAFLLDPINSSGTPVVGDEAEFIFYDTPAISFSGGGAAATFSISVYERDLDPYQ